MPQQYHNHEEGTANLLPVEILQEFPIGSFVENIAIRQTGQVLVTVAFSGELFMLDAAKPRAAPVLVHKFEEGITGIAEMGKDQFFVSSGVLFQPGTWSIFHVDMSGFDGPGSNAAIRKIVDAPEALFLNGSASFEEGSILVVDSVLGVIYRVFVHEGRLEKWLQHDLFTKPSDSQTPGINGIKVHNGSVFCSNTDARTIIHVDLADGQPKGEPTLLYHDIGVDDFAIDEKGSIYAATHVYQSVIKIDPDGKRARIAGGPDSAIVAGTTAAAFGRAPGDSQSLYVTTTGGISLPVNGEVGPARVLKIQTGSA
jgi:hypothetical protein